MCPNYITDRKLRNTAQRWVNFILKVQTQFPQAILKQ
uniref:Uncharacterized protein n=1 Tax=Anguilla anguilla TaxID=7936 RepID=A0A0E9SUM3_ANGAN